MQTIEECYQTFFCKNHINREPTYLELTLFILFKTQLVHSCNDVEYSGVGGQTKNKNKPNHLGLCT